MIVRGTINRWVKMRRPLLAGTAAGLALLVAACGGGGGSQETRDSVRAVGSSTVYPFARAVAEQFSRSNPDFKSPVIESTGTGGGIALFCSGVGPATPDIVNASRRIKPDEFATCQANGVTEITEIQVGLDGIAIASAQGGLSFNLTPEMMYRAVAANPYGEAQTARLWSDIDPALPEVPILVYGPPSTSGTRDAFNELVMTPGCEANAAMAAIGETDEDRLERICTETRSDGVFVDQGEQDNLIVQKIAGNPNAVGIFGFSYLEENADRVQGLPLNGVEPTYENIASFRYAAARPMFIYVKNAHLDAIPGLRDYIAAWRGAWGPDGPLTRIGLVANPPEQAAASTAAATQFTPLAAADLD